MPTTIDNLFENLDRITLEEAFLIFDNPLLSRLHGERVSEDLRLKMIWHVLTSSQSTFQIPPALATWLGKQAQGQNDTTMEPLWLDTEQAWNAWFADLKQTFCMEDCQLLHLLHLLKQNHENIYQEIRQLDENAFPNPNAPFTDNNLITIENKLGLNLAQTSLKSEGGMAIRFFRVLIDRLHLLATTLQEASDATAPQKKATLQTVLDKHDLPHFTALLLAGANPNITVDGLPLYQLTLQPQRVDKPLAFFNILSQCHNLKLRPNVFDLLLNVDATDEDFAEAVTNAVNQRGPLSLQNWLDLLAHTNLSAHQNGLVQFAKVMIPRMKDLEKLSPQKLTDFLETVLMATLPQAPKLASSWLPCARRLSPEQRNRLADTLTKQTKQWNPLLFDAALKADLFLLSDTNAKELIDFLLAERLSDTAGTPSSDNSSQNLEDTPEEENHDWTESMTVWMRRMLQARDDDTLCNLIVTLISKAPPRRVTRIMRSMPESLKEDADSDFTVKLYGTYKRCLPESFQSFLSDAPQKHLNHLLHLSVITYTDLDDETQVKLVNQLKAEDLRRLKSQGFHISSECLMSFARQGKLILLREILDDQSYMQTQHLPLTAELTDSEDTNLLVPLCSAAVTAGQCEVLNYLLALKPELLTSHDPDNNTLLHLMLMKSPSDAPGMDLKHYQECLRILISNMKEAYLRLNRQVDCVNEVAQYYTPLSLAARENNIPAIQVLLEAKADPNTGASSPVGPAIMCTQSNKVRQLLLDHQATLDARDQYGNYPLMQLSKSISFKDFKTMLDKTSPSLLSTANVNGKTILHTYVQLIATMASEDAEERTRYLDYLPQLIRKYGLDINAIMHPNTRDAKGNMHPVSVHNRSAPPLAIAIQQQDWDTAQRLIDLGANINQVNAKGENILFIRMRLKICKKLMETYHVNPARCNYLKQNLLFKLCQEYNRDAFDYVRQHGANIRQVDCDGNTLLIRALECRNIPLMMDLLNMGLRFDATKLSAKQSYELMKKLIFLGQDSDSDLEEFKILFSKCLDAGLQLDPPVGSHIIPLLFIPLDNLTENTLPILTFLIDDLKLPLRTQNEEGYTLLHFLTLCASKYDRNLVQPVLEYLLANPTLHLTVKAQTQDGNTLLHTATDQIDSDPVNSRLWLWKLLCEYIPTLPQIQNQAGLTPFFFWLKKQSHVITDQNIWDEELKFWLLRTPQEDTDTQAQISVLEKFLLAHRKQTSLVAFQKLCQAGFTCHNLRYFALAPTSHFKWYVDNVLKGNHKLLQEQMDQEMQWNDSNLCTMALSEGRSDLVLLLLDYTYNPWKTMDIKRFLTALFTGGDGNVTLLKTCFNQWHWPRQLLTECAHDEDGKAINALDLFLQCQFPSTPFSAPSGRASSHTTTRLGLLKLLSEELLPNTYTYGELLKKLMAADDPYEDSLTDFVKSVEWLVSNGADPCITSNLQALTLLLNFSRDKTLIVNILNKVNNYARGRDLQLPIPFSSTERSTLLCTAILTPTPFILCQMLHKLHIRIEAKEDDKFNPIEYAIAHDRPMHLYWLLDAYKEKLTAPYLAQLLSLALTQAQEVPNDMLCIHLLVEQYHANPRQLDHHGRLPLSRVPQGSPIWNYLNDHCPKE